MCVVVTYETAVKFNCCRNIVLELQLHTTTLYLNNSYNKNMKLTERHTFKTNELQKKTLIVLRKKYKINTSNFIRDAINEKLNREKSVIFKNHKEVQSYLDKFNDCPF